jgi:hypothetical protein
MFTFFVASGTLISRNYVVGGAETCDVSRDDVSGDGFSRKHSVKVCFDQEQVIFVLRNIVKWNGKHMTV